MKIIKSKFHPTITDDQIGILFEAAYQQLLSEQCNPGWLHSLQVIIVR